MSRTTKVIQGTNGNDRIVRLAKDSTNYEIYGLAGHDTISGGRGHDKLYGGLGNDSLAGGEGNDVLKAFGGLKDGNPTQELDQLNGGKGADLFDLRDAVGSPGYVGGGDNLAPLQSSGFAIIQDFKPGEGDKIKLSGFPAHYALKPISWGQSFGAPNTEKTTDVALIYTGPEQDQYDVVGVLQDVSVEFLNKPDSLLKNPNLFVFDSGSPSSQASAHPRSGARMASGDEMRIQPYPYPIFDQIIQGTERSDLLTGTEDDDIILGLGKNDTISGAGGNDILIGGAGKDVISGGARSDRFVFTNPSHGNDLIKDFSQTEEDTLVFTKKEFGLPAGVLSDTQFVLGTKAKDADDRLIYNQKKGELFFDADGIGKGKAVKIATLENKSALSASNILVVDYSTLLTQPVL